MIEPEARPDTNIVAERAERGEVRVAQPGVRVEPGEVPGLAVRTAAGTWVQVHSRRDPHAEADRLVAAAFERGEPDVIVAIAPGLGYVVEAVGRRSRRTRVLAIEPFAGCADAMRRRRDWHEWTAGGRLTLLVGPEYPGASDAWRVMDGVDGQPPVIVSPILEREFPEQVSTARALADRAIFGARANADARSALAGRYLLNTLRNQAIIRQSGDPAALFGAFTKVPAFIVSAGPSLDSHLRHLAETRSHAVLIAVDTALRPLLGAGVVPHITVAVDPSPTNARHLTDLPDTAPGWLVAEASLDPAAFAAFPGRVVTFRVADHHPWPWLRRHGLDRTTLRAWGSVATTAFDLALRLGCDPVYFAGQDLAYTGGRPYCRGTRLEEEWAREVARGRTLPEVWRAAIERRSPVRCADARGMDTETTPTLVSFRDWLVDAAAATDREVVNVTGEGILVGSGVGQQELAKVVERLRRHRARDLHGDVSRACRGSARHAGVSVPPLPSDIEEWSRSTGTCAADLERAARSGTTPPDGSGARAGIASARQPTLARLPELTAAFIASLSSEPVPSWAEGAVPAPPMGPAALTDPRFERLLAHLPVEAWLEIGGRLDRSAAHDASAALYRRLVEGAAAGVTDASLCAAADRAVAALYLAGSFDECRAFIEAHRDICDATFALQCLSSIVHLQSPLSSAMPIVRAWQAANPGTPGVRLNLALLHASAGELPAALRLIDDDEPLWGDVPIPALVRASCLRLGGRFGDALAVLRSVLPRCPTAAADYVWTSALGHPLEGARQSAREAVAVLPVDAVVAMVALRQEDVEPFRCAMALMQAELCADARRLVVDQPGLHAGRVVISRARERAAWEARE